MTNKSLKSFSVLQKVFLKRFRESKSAAGEPFETYAVELRRLVDRWISLSKVEKTYEGLLGLILSEQLLQSVSHDLATLCEKNERSFDNLIKSAESYRLCASKQKLRSELRFLALLVLLGEDRPSEQFCSTSSFCGYGGYQSGQSGPSFLEQKRIWFHSAFSRWSISRSGCSEGNGRHRWFWTSVFSTQGLLSLQATGSFSSCLSMEIREKPVPGLYFQSSP